MTSILTEFVPKTAIAPQPVKAVRPELTGITLYATYPDGSSRVLACDPSKLEGMFWSNWAVWQI